MIDAIKRVLTEALKRVGQVKGAVLWVTALYLLFVTAVALSGFFVWAWEFFTTGHPDKKWLLDYINVLVGPYMIGFMTFVLGCFVDPSKFEKGKEPTKPSDGCSGR